MFVNEAITYAEKSEMMSQHHGAVVIYRGKIVGRGYNKYCVENINKVNRWSVHAEVDAINNALRKISHEDLRKSTLIVVRKLKENSEYKENKRENKNKNENENILCEEIGLSAPCRHCANFILKNGIKRCYYS